MTCFRYECKTGMYLSSYNIQEKNYVRTVLFPYLQLSSLALNS